MGQTKSTTTTTTKTATAPGIMTSWVRIPQPNGDVLLRPGKPVATEEEISTLEASRILGVSPRTVRYYCERGVIKESDWRFSPGSTDKAGKLFIRRQAVLDLRFTPNPA